jgi:hypothetical protein
MLSSMCLWYVFELILDLKWVLNDHAIYHSHSLFHFLSNQQKQYWRVKDDPLRRSCLLNGFLGRSCNAFIGWTLTINCFISTCLYWSCIHFIQCYFTFQQKKIIPIPRWNNYDNALSHVLIQNIWMVDRIRFLWSPISYVRTLHGMFVHNLWYLDYCWESRTWR